MKKRLISALTVLALFAGFSVSNTGSYAATYPGPWTIITGINGVGSNSNISSDGKTVTWDCNGTGTCANVDAGGLHIPAVGSVMGGGQATGGGLATLPD